MLCLAAAVAAAQPPPVPTTSVFPMTIGTYWIYRGDVRWTDPNSRVRSAPIEWRMEVVDFSRHGSTAVALVRGAPMDLAGYRPGLEAQYSLLVRRGNSYYFSASAQAPEHFLHFKHRKPWPFKRPGIPGPLMRPQDVWFSVPLAVGQKTCGPDQPPSADASYCWLVETKGKADLSAAKGVSIADPVEYDLAFRTRPEDEFIAIVPGLGITGYHYQHHGTVSETRLKLVPFHFSSGPPR